MLAEQNADSCGKVEVVGGDTLDNLHGKVSLSPRKMLQLQMFKSSSFVLMSRCWCAVGHVLTFYVVSLAPL